jgi:nitrite reductase/ring-hydroxylating ferredoxin subunit
MGNYRDLPGAPPPGAVLAEAASLDATGVLALEIDSGDGAFPVLLVKGRGGPAAFVNLCPHRDLPLTYRSSAVLSADATLVRCSNHDAAFRTDDGHGVDGVAQGCALDVIPITIDADGMIRVDDPGRAIA